MKNTKKPKARAEIKLGGTKTVEGFEFYIGYCSLESGDGFQQLYSPYSINFYGKICLTGLDIRPVPVLDYKDMCARFAKTVGKEMKENRVTAYELVNGSPDTGIVFDTRIGLFCYYSNAGAKMDPIPKDGIEQFKRTLDEYLQG